MMRTIRALTLAEIVILVDWAAAEGWNPGLNDAVAFHAADPTGFIGAFVGGRMVAGISAVAYDDRFGFIGLYICHPDWRKQGHGKAVWDAAMDYLGTRTIGLDGVPEQQANYAAMGFAPAYETVRMSGPLAGDRSPGRSFAIPNDVRDLDRQCFPAERDAFLAAWLAAPSQTLTASRHGAVKAYAVVRPCRVGAKIGPLFATESAMALDLLSGISGPVQIDVPTAQTSWLDALAAKGLTPGFRTMRMYRGPAPAIGLDRVFGVTSLELG